MVSIRPNSDEPRGTDGVCLSELSTDGNRTEAPLRVHLDPCAAPVNPARPVTGHMWPLLSADIVSGGDGSHLQLLHASYRIYMTTSVTVQTYSKTSAFTGNTTRAWLDAGLHAYTITQACSLEAVKHLKNTEPLGIYCSRWEKTYSMCSVGLVTLEKSLITSY